MNAVRRKGPEMEWWVEILTTHHLGIETRATTWDIITSHVTKPEAIEAARARAKALGVTHRVVEIARYPLEEFHP